MSAERKRNINPINASVTASVQQHLRLLQLEQRLNGDEIEIATKKRGQSKGERIA